MKKLLIPLITTPLIYFTIALTLTFLPFERNQPEQGLDFSAIEAMTAHYGDVEEQRYVARDGRKLFYRRFSGNNDIALVLLHGSGSEGRYLVQLAQQLQRDAGITVIVPDLRGHGRSQGDSSGDVSYLGQYEDDLEDLLHFLKQNSGIKRVLVGGHSSGGGLALKYDGRERSDFDGRLLLAPYLGYQAPTVKPNSGGWVQVIERRFAGLAMLNNVGISAFNDLPVLFFNRPEAVADQLQVDSYSYRLSQSFSPSDYQADFERQQTPLLVLVGEQDEAFYATEFTDVIASHAPTGELHIIPTLRHLDMVLSEQTATLILQWLQQHYLKND